MFHIIHAHSTYTYTIANVARDAVRFNELEVMMIKSITAQTQLLWVGPKELRKKRKKKERERERKTKKKNRVN